MTQETFIKSAVDIAFEFGLVQDAQIDRRTIEALEAAYLAGRISMREEAALACEEECALHHSELNLSMRTEVGKESAIAQGYGAANCAVRIRAIPEGTP